jgi:hypothetical protein
MKDTFRIVLFLLILNCGDVYSQSKNPFNNRSSSKFEVHPGVIGTYGLLTSYIGISYNFTERISASVGPLIGFPFSNGIGLSSGANIKVLSLGKVSLSADFLYKLNGGALSRVEDGDSVFTEYGIPPSQFISSGISLDIMFKDKTRLRITTSYNIALSEYKPTLEKGIENTYEEELINDRLSNSLGIHFIYAVPIGKRW